MMSLSRGLITELFALHDVCSSCGDGGLSFYVGPVQSKQTTSKYNYHHLDNNDSDLSFDRYTRTALPHRDDSNFTDEAFVIITQLLSWFLLSVGLAGHSVHCQHSSESDPSSWKYQLRKVKDRKEGTPQSDCPKCALQSLCVDLREEACSEKAASQMLEPVQAWSTSNTLETVYIHSYDQDASYNPDKSVGGPDCATRSTTHTSETPPPYTQVESNLIFQFETRGSASLAEIRRYTSEKLPAYSEFEVNTESESHACKSVAMLVSSQNHPSKRPPSVSPLLWLPIELLFKILDHLDPCSWVCLGLTSKWFYNQCGDRFRQPVSLVTPLLPDTTSRYRWKLWNLLVDFMGPELAYDPKYVIFRTRGKVGTPLSKGESKAFWSERSLFDRFCVVNEKASREITFKKVGIGWLENDSEIEEWSEEPSVSHIEHLVPSLPFLEEASKERRWQWAGRGVFDENIDDWCSQLGDTDMELGWVVYGPSKAAMKDRRFSRKKTRKVQFAPWRYG